MLSIADKKILNIIQTNLPVCPRPFAEIGKLTGLSEAQVIERINHLKETGYIRRLGPFFNSDKLGYVGTLVAVKVADGYMAQVAEVINGFAGATHNYERKGKYNLWFTLLAPDAKTRDMLIEKVRHLSGVESVMNLTSHKKYKVNVNFKLK